MTGVSAPSAGGVSSSPPSGVLLSHEGGRLTPGVFLHPFAPSLLPVFYHIAISFLQLGGWGPSPAAPRPPLELSCLAHYTVSVPAAGRPACPQPAQGNPQGSQPAGAQHPAGLHPPPRVPLEGMPQCLVSVLGGCPPTLRNSQVCGRQSWELSVCLKSALKPPSPYLSCSYFTLEHGRGFFAPSALTHE